MNKIRQWYLDNYTEITWFLIGFLTLDGLIRFGQGNYLGALFSFFIVGLNYAFRHR